MLTTPAGKKLASDVAELVHASDKIMAARMVSDVCSLGLKVEKERDAIPVLQHYIHYLMNDGGMEETASILWTPNLFTSAPKFTKDLWQFFDETNQGLIMGAASCSKSYGIGVRIFLEWIRDPQWTSVIVIGPKEDHLERNLFSHLVRLHSNATLPMPGEIGELFIGISRRDQVSSILGQVVPKGNTKKAGTIQGAKTVQRMHAHPIFGPQSRLFIFVDEIENVPGGLWNDIDNVLSNMQEKGAGFKIFGAFNPTNQHAEVGKRAEPPFGWSEFDLDKHYRWKSIRGWDVLRLDGEQCENVVAGKVIFPGLQTRFGLDTIARNAGGKETAGYYSMGRGAYPPSGVSLSIIPPGMIPRMRGEYIWYDTPQPVGSCDIALEGGDAAIFTLGRFGKATGVKRPPSLQHPQGHTEMFKDRMGSVVPRWGLQIDQQITFPKGDTVAMKDEIVKLAKRAGVRPHFLCLDHTGHGRGVADLIKYEWSQAIHAVNYSDGASKEKVMQEDTQTCDVRFERMCSELWFAMRSWFEFGYVMINPSMDISNVTPQLTQRNFRPSGKKDRVETKKDYMTRTGQSSPNEADSFSLIVHAARKGSGLIPSMKGDAMNANEEDDEGWPTADVRIDESNRADYLSEGMEIM